MSLKLILFCRHDLVSLKLILFCLNLNSKYGLVNKLLTFSCGKTMYVGTCDVRHQENLASNLMFGTSLKDINIFSLTVYIFHVVPTGLT